MNKMILIYLFYKKLHNKHDILFLHTIFFFLVLTFHNYNYIHLIVYKHRFNLLIIMILIFHPNTFLVQ